MRWRPGDILPQGFTCPHCGKNSGFTKEEDTLDGWFDSGSTHFASMQKDQGFWPATMYMEGLDQYRGWFQSSLLTAVGAGQGRALPGVRHPRMDRGRRGQGHAQVPGQRRGPRGDLPEVRRGYDPPVGYLRRLPWDVRCSDKIFKQLSQNYLKFRNTARYCLGNLDGFDPNELVKPEEMLELDRWAVTKLNELTEKCFAAYDNYEFHVVSHTINDFCVVELSSFYLDIIKDRLYCEEVWRPGAPLRPDRPVAHPGHHDQAVCPILAFTCDEIWQAMPHRADEDSRNVVLNEMNQPFAST